MNKTVETLTKKILHPSEANVVYENAQAMIDDLRNELEKRKKKGFDKTEETSVRIDKFENEVIKNLNEEERERRVEVTRNELNLILDEGKYETIIKQFKTGKRGIMTTTKEWLEKAKEIVDGGKKIGVTAAEKVKEIQEHGLEETLKWAKGKFLWALGLSGGIAGLATSLGQKSQRRYISQYKIMIL